MHGLVSANNGTANETIDPYIYNTDAKIGIVDGGAAQADIFAGTITVNTLGKLGVSFAANDIAACFNGGTVQTDTSATLPTPDRLWLGVSSGSGYLNGHLAALKFYNVAKSDAELQALTA